MMVIPVVVWLFGLFQVRAFSPVSSLADCPKVSPDNNVKLNKVSGTWRLAYLYIDDVNDVEEDNSCGVAEIMQVNDTKMEILLYIDSGKDDVIDRYTKEFEVTIQSPGEWLIYTSFKYLEVIHVTVVGFFGDHLILTFCATPFNPLDSSDGEKTTDYDVYRNGVEKESVSDIFKAPTYDKLLKDFNDGTKTQDSRSVRHREESFFRGKRYTVNGNAEPNREPIYNSFLSRIPNKAPKKHLWTAILVRNNKVSALQYIENASYLMKYGFNISKGQLISFGSCALNK